MGPVFVNRILNLKHIQAVGFDMDHTLVRYKIKEFEDFTYHHVLQRLIEQKGYPALMKEWRFDAERAIRGLVVDTAAGNILKVNQFNRVKTAYHGLLPLDYPVLKEFYRGQVIDLNQERYMSIDTSFSVSFCSLYSQLVSLKDQGEHLRDLSYEVLARDCRMMIDYAHRDGSLKAVVRQNPQRFVHQDPQLAAFLEQYRREGKILFLVTNSDYLYTKLLLDYALTPFLQEHAGWEELFQVSITQASKPRFFTDQLPFLQVKDSSGLLANTTGPIQRGIFQGGCATGLEEGLGIYGDQILYIGDHIFGDILKLKKSCQWRTALVVEELASERDQLQRARSTQNQIDALMERKEELERELWQGRCPELSRSLEKIDGELQKLLVSYNRFFNPYWGETFRAGRDQSHLAWQMERFACIYMANLTDLHSYSSRHYFRPRRRPLPHELLD